MGVLSGNGERTVFRYSRATQNVLVHGHLRPAFSRVRSRFSPWWNGYRFPTEFILGNLVQQWAGWWLAGIAIAWVLGRRVRRSH